MFDEHLKGVDFQRDRTNASSKYPKHRRILRVVWWESTVVVVVEGRVGRVGSTPKQYGA
jgi:hypothetical protein